MFNWLRRRRLSSRAQKKLMILHARAEEALIATHVANVLELLEVLEDEVELERGIDLYVEMMSLDEATTTTVTTRLLATLEGPSQRTGLEQGRFRHAFRD